MDGRNPFAPLGNHGKPLFVGIYRGIESFQGFLGGAGFHLSTVVCTQNTYPKSRKPSRLSLPLLDALDWLFAGGLFCHLKD